MCYVLFFSHEQCVKNNNQSYNKPIEELEMISDSIKVYDVSSGGAYTLRA